MQDKKLEVRSNWKAPRLRKLGTLRDVAGEGSALKQITTSGKS